MKREERREFIRRLEILRHQKRVTQQQIGDACDVSRALVDQWLDPDGEKNVPAIALCKLVPLLGLDVFSCLPGGEKLIVTDKPVVIGNVSDPTRDDAALLKEASELAVAAIEADADGFRSTAEQARVQKEADDVHRAAQRVAATRGI